MGIGLDWIGLDWIGKIPKIRSTEVLFRRENELIDTLLQTRG